MYQHGIPCTYNMHVARIYRNSRTNLWGTGDRLFTSYSTQILEEHLTRNICSRLRPTIITLVGKESIDKRYNPRANDRSQTKNRSHTAIQSLLDYTSANPNPQRHYKDLEVPTPHQDVFANCWRDSTICPAVGLEKGSWRKHCATTFQDVSHILFGFFGLTPRKTLIWIVVGCRLSGKGDWPLWSLIVINISV